MRKTITAALALLLVLLLAACGGGAADSQATSSSESEYGKIQWPKSEIASLLPVPESTIGRISWDSSDDFTVYIAETSKEQYGAYVDECQERGFTVDYTKGDGFFYAYNADGYDLTVSYQDDNVMYISIYAPSESEESEPEETEDSEEPGSPPEELSAPAEPTDGIGAEFKEAMDSYEAFFDEYCAFMKKYAESENAADLLADYTNYMTQYLETMEKFEALEDDLSDVELKYYLEVSTRISQKLLDVSAQI